MGSRHILRQLVRLGLVVNAYRPKFQGWGSVPSFFAGWLTTELAPQLMIGSTWGTLRRTLTPTPSNLFAAALGAVNTAGLAGLVASAEATKRQTEQALVAGLGADCAALLAAPAVPDRTTVSPAALLNPLWLGVLVAPRLPLPLDPRVRQVRGIKYAAGGRRYELAVFHRHDSPPGAPVLLQIHGGGWVYGEHTQQAMPLMMHMAAKGWVVVAANYPLSPKARMPAHIVALKRAIAWIREHIGDYGGDASFLAVTGGSAGGHLAAMLALTGNDARLQPGFADADTSVHACVPLYGVYDFTADNDVFGSAERLRLFLRPTVMPSDAAYPDDYREVSPIWRITPDAPPFFVLHGSNDTIAPVQEARRFTTRLREVSRNEVAYAELAGAQHAFDLFPSIRTGHAVAAIARFLEWAHQRHRRGSAAGNAPDPEGQTDAAS